MRLVRGIPQGRVIEGGGIPIELRRFADVRLSQLGAAGSLVDSRSPLQNYSSKRLS